MQKIKISYNQEKGTIKCQILHIMVPIYYRNRIANLRLILNYKKLLYQRTILHLLATYVLKRFYIYLYFGKSYTNLALTA